MATNGESARKWLEENKNQVSEQRVVQIRSSLVKKINLLAESSNDMSDEYQGLLEALDVMDNWLQQGGTAQEKPVELPDLDYRSLVEEPSEPAPLLSQQEKRQRFQSLLKASKEQTPKR